MDRIPGWNMAAGTEAEPVIPAPDDFAWTENELTNLWVPVWMTIQRLASELIRCSCKECGEADIFMVGGGKIFVLVTQILEGIPLPPSYTYGIEARLQ